MMRLAILALLAGTLPLRAEDYPAFHAVSGVTSGDVLNIRQLPDATSPVIGSLAPDATGVEVVGVTGNWALVNTAEGSGYASLRYLRREEGAPWNALTAPLTCLGTEPFWSLVIQPQEGRATFSDPETEGDQSWPISEIWPGLPWSPVAALALPGGIAVLHPAECSDGMSDRSYGIAVDLLLTGTERNRLSGCCQLGPAP